MEAKTKKFHAFNDVPLLCVICLHMYWIKEKFLFMNSKKFIYYKPHMKLCDISTQGEHDENI